MKSIIGKRYLPIDNSYSVNITNPIKRSKVFIGDNIENKGYIAGTSSFSDNPHPCIILTNIFKCTIKPRAIDKIIEEEMVIVKDLKDNQCYTILWNENGLNIEERIKIINESIKLNGSKEPLFNPSWE